MIAEIRGFFKRIRTPYNAGSVTDNNAVIPVEIPASLLYDRIENNRKTGIYYGF